MRQCAPLQDAPATTLPAPVPLSLETPRTLAAYDRSKHHTRTLGLLHRAFRGWCHFTFISRRAKQRMRRAELWHSKELLQRRVLREWFRVAMQMHRVTLHNRWVWHVAATVLGVPSESALSCRYHAAFRLHLLLPSVINKRCIIVMPPLCTGTCQTCSKQGLTWRGSTTHKLTSSGSLL